MGRVAPDHQAVASALDSPCRMAGRMSRRLLRDDARQELAVADTRRLLTVGREGGAYTLHVAALALVMCFAKIAFDPEPVFFILDDDLSFWEPGRAIAVDQSV